MKNLSKNSKTLLHKLKNQKRKWKRRKGPQIKTTMPLNMKISIDKEHLKVKNQKSNCQKLKSPIFQIQPKLKLKSKRKLKLKEN